MVDAGPEFVRWFNRYERQSSSPGDHLTASKWIRELDITSVLPTVAVPTLVLQSRDDHFAPVAAGRYLAEHIPGARYIELEGVDHIPWYGRQELVLDAIEEFVLVETSNREPDRVLATVLFTDIVGSTERASAEGDGAWRRILDDHDHVVRREVARRSGRVIKATGDGAMATFDRPGQAVEAAAAIRDAVRTLGIDVRAGAHTGEIELRDDDIGGIGVHIAARVAAAADVGEVLVSRTVCDLVVGSGLSFHERGERELKGVPGRWQLYALAPQPR
jgi:class 3 adenylate cyclase